MKLSQLLALTLTCTILSATAAAQQLLVTDSTNQRVMLFDAQNGSIINPSYIDLTSITVPGGLSPFEAMAGPNGDILVTDTIANTIFRFSPDGQTYLGKSRAELNIVLGIEVAYGSVWVTNGVATASVPGPALVQLDSNLDIVATYPVPNIPADVLAFTVRGVQGLMVSESTVDRLLFFPLSNLDRPIIHATSAGLAPFNEPRQMTPAPLTGDILVAGFSFPSGVFTRGGDNGGPLSWIDTDTIAGLDHIQGVFELGNGNTLFTNDTGVHIHSHTQGITTIFSGIDARYITPFTPPQKVTTFCDPANNNSTGSPTALTASLNGGSLHLEVSHGPTNQFGYFLVGTGLNETNPILLGDGRLCMAITSPNVLGRYNISGTAQNSIGSFDTGGVFKNLVGTSSIGTGFDVPAILPLPGAPTILPDQIAIIPFLFQIRPANTNEVA